MIYKSGDCLTIPAHKSGFIATYVTGGDEKSYYIAFFSYEGEHSPSAEYFDTPSLFVATFEHENQTYASFDVVTIERALLEGAKDVRLVSKIDLSGMIGLHGLTPMEAISDISAYFEQYYAGFDSKDINDFYLPVKRTLMPFDEIRRRATPINPFPTIKLFKPEHETLRFWQIYGSSDPATIVVSWGSLGLYEGHEEFNQNNLGTLKERYLRLIQEKRIEGFEECMEYKDMILQFGTDDEWGDSDDLGFRNQIWELLNAQLFWTGNGDVSGGDIGSGTVNLFFRAISPELAANTINSLIKERQINRSYLVAMERNGQFPSEIKVIYPEHYSGEFNY